MMEKYTVEVKVPTIQVIVDFNDDYFEWPDLVSIAREELVKRGNKIGVFMENRVMNYNSYIFTFEYLG